MLGKLAVLGALGYAGYRYYEKNKVGHNGAAFAPDEPVGQFRNAGAASTATGEGNNWTKEDEVLDETYPASDATAKY